MAARKECQDIERLKKAKRGSGVTSSLEVLHDRMKKGGGLVARLRVTFSRDQDQVFAGVVLMLWSTNGSLRTLVREMGRDGS